MNILKSRESRNFEWRLVTILVLVCLSAQITLARPPTPAEIKIRDTSLKLLAYTTQNIGEWDYGTDGSLICKVDRMQIALNAKGEILSFKNKRSGSNAPVNQKLVSDSLTWVSRALKILPKAPEGLKWKSVPTRRNDSRFDERQYSFKLVDAVIPTYGRPGADVNFSLKDGKVTFVLIRQWQSDLSKKAKISAQEATKTALEKFKFLRQFFPASGSKPKHVIQIPAQKVYHISNVVHDPEYVDAVLKLPKQEQLKGAFYEPGFFMKRPPTHNGAERLSLCWLLKISGDTCVVDANTGRVHYYGYAEAGSYYSLDKAGKIFFN